MCVRWDTVLKENGQLENTPVVTSPLVPGDTIRQCPRQCEPRCCTTGSQPRIPQQSSAPQRPPACTAGCPRACYPACRPGCCNPPPVSPPVSPWQTSVQNYQPAVAPFAPMSQPMPQPMPQAMPQPVATFSGPQPASAVHSRSIIPGTTNTAVSVTSCPLPCSPVCVPHCTKHCCESYD